VGFNRAVDEATARELLTTFIEAVVAPGYTDEALALLGEKKDLRLARFEGLADLPRFEGDAAAPDLKVLPDGSMLVQRPYLTRIRSAADLVARPAAGDEAIAAAPTDAQLADLLFAWYVNPGVRSNGIVLARGGRTLAVGTGEQERVGAVEQALAKARQKGHDLDGAVVSSDAFFPFRDAIDALAEAGVRAVIQPGGSLRDAEVIRACNERGLAMVFTGERCFGHF
jgi:phosphoribosylaminoimidazolecarboxamide formyltransferase/IMP cyclohydrolase